MNRCHIGLLAGCVASAAAVAQNGYTYEMRIIPDGAADSPGGPTPAVTFPIGNPISVQVSRVGFWLQARVSQTTGQNWGIGRVASPSGQPSFITLTDTLPNGAQLLRGTVDAAGLLHGRGIGYRTFGADLGLSGNTGINPYPNIQHAENGGIDGGADHTGADRLYGFDAYVGPTRVDQDADGDGVFHSPWGVNGTTNPNPNTDPVSVPLGQFSPWANIYRFWVSNINGSNAHIVTISARAQVSGFSQIANPTGASSTYVAVVLGGANSPTLNTTYSFTFQPGGNQSPCAADLGGAGGSIGHDFMLDNNDFIAFIYYYFDQSPMADLGGPGGLPPGDNWLDNNDFVAFINLFFAGC